jgi:hypothetical protein
VTLKRKLGRLAALLFVLPLLAACGDDGGGDGDGSDPTDTPTASAGASGSACDLISTDEVSEAVGVTVQDGVGADGPVVTGGTQSTCTWRGVEDASATAMVTIYSDASAADSVRQDDDPPVPELGEDAFVGPFASVYAYSGEGSFMAQWYDFSATDEENLPKSTALAHLVHEKL